MCTFVCFVFLVCCARRYHLDEATEWIDLAAEDRAGRVQWLPFAVDVEDWPPPPPPPPPPPVAGASAGKPHRSGGRPAGAGGGGYRSRDDDWGADEDEEFRPRMRSKRGGGRVGGRGRGRGGRGRSRGRGGSGFSYRLSAAERGGYDDEEDFMDVGGDELGGLGGGGGAELDVEADGVGAAGGADGAGGGSGGGGGLEALALLGGLDALAAAALEEDGEGGGGGGPDVSGAVTDGGAATDGELGDAAREAGGDGGEGGAADEMEVEEDRVGQPPPTAGAECVGWRVRCLPMASGGAAGATAAGATDGEPGGGAAATATRSDDWFTCLIMSYDPDSDLYGVELDSGEPYTLRLGSMAQVVWLGGGAAARRAHEAAREAGEREAAAAERRRNAPPEIPVVCNGMQGWFLVAQGLVRMQVRGAANPMGAAGTGVRGQYGSKPESLPSDRRALCRATAATNPLAPATSGWSGAVTDGV